MQTKKRIQDGIFDAAFEETSQEFEEKSLSEAVKKSWQEIGEKLGEKFTENELENLLTEGEDSKEEYELSETFKVIFQKKQELFQRRFQEILAEKRGEFTDEDLLIRVQGHKERLSTCTLTLNEKETIFKTILEQVLFCALDEKKTFLGTLGNGEKLAYCVPGINDEDITTFGKSYPKGLIFPNFTMSISKMDGEVGTGGLVFDCSSSEPDKQFGQYKDNELKSMVTRHLAAQYCLGGGHAIPGG